MINERLKALISELGISQRQFALKIGLDPGYLSRILKGTSVPPERILLLIEKVFSVNKNWLESGEGEIFSNQGSSLVKKQILETIDTLDEHQVASLKVFLKYLQEENTKK
ncbi:MAG: helix-turn-helix transcriptional regulator [Bacillales bacterium]|nr:helix-turn-helix transcriptional regulator [Bacillales bacterium]